jgi:acyl-CoA dehydrogenase
MDFAPSARTIELQERLEDFMVSHVYPAEPVFRRQVAMDRWAKAPIVEELKAEARRRGLWNLFLPDDEHGAGLTNLEYAPLAEIMGRSLMLAPTATNCAAPDTGNMEILAMFGTAEQKAQWLEPLLDGEIRSAFGMTEPDVASSDATNIGTSIVRDGNHYVINGRKWWTSGAMHPDCKIMIVMGKTDPKGPMHQQQSMVLVPMDTPGVTVERPLTVYGYDDAPHGHAEVSLADVRVPDTNVLGEEGTGFAIAQARLGPGRIHHCMRLLGMAERALDAMCVRAHERVAFGKTLAEQGVVQEWIADSRIEIEQARLLVLKTAWLMDTVGNKGARIEISAIKVAVPNVALKVLDRAVQTHGGAGVSDDVPIAEMWAQARTLRIADGPDEVHRRSVARRELRKHAPAL